jgi:LPS-assembly protein
VVGRGQTVQREKGVATAAWSHLAAVFVLVCGLSAALTAPGRAQQKVDDHLLDNVIGTAATANTAVDKTKPMLLQADNLVYDNQNNKVTAQGNVEIYYNNYALTADQVIYDQAANTLAASGNVRIKEPNGSVITADQITLSDDLRDGFIGSLRVVTQDDVRIAASKATRQEGETTVFENGVFTPCKPCKDNPNAPPIWRIRAQKITHVQSESNVYFENASFDVYGVPVAYIPYFYAPDPSVKRRTGFLAPSAGYSTDLGYTAEIPYFWAISPSADLTFNPMVMSLRGLLAKATYRQRLANGTFKVDLAGIEETDEPSDKPTDSKFRGSLVTQGDFEFGSWWKAGWNATLETDETFRRYYKLDSVLTTNRVSEAHLVGQSERSYFGAYAYQFGGLLTSDTQAAGASAVPSIDYHYVAGTPVIGGEFSFDLNALALNRQFIDMSLRETDTIANTDGRVIAQANWRSQIIDSIGQVFTPFLSARGDVYQTNGFSDPSAPGVVFDQTVTRATGTVGLQYQFPFVAHASWGSQVFEPIGQILVRPNNIEQGKLPNEDAQSLVFDDTLLFDLDKFSGYDRIETGTRANIGVQYTVQGNNGGHLRAVLGQSYQLAGDNPFAGRTGLDKARSDYVAGFYLSPSANFEFFSQSRFDADTFELRREDFATSIKAGPISLATNYSLERGNDAVGKPRQSQEILSSASLKLDANWSALASARYDIDNGAFITDSLGLKYSSAEDCVGVAVTYSESYIRDKDVQPDKTLMLRVDLKYLGGTQVTTDSLGNNGAVGALH